MDYIVLDMEWNQPWPGSPTAQKAAALHFRGEIIQIGAVRIRDEHELADEFQILIRPKFFRRLNRRISKLTGIRESQLNSEGVSMEEAMSAFRAWCGEEPIFLTWGFDDISILRENLHLFQIDDGWTQRWYNAQMLFNSQTDGSSAQKALKTAMEIFSIEPTRQAHDALGDAYHTAQICARLDLQRGIAEYGKSLEQHVDGFHGAEIPGCLSRHVFPGYAGKDAALAAMSGEENKCPICGEQMRGTRWFAQAGRRYMDEAACPEHGKFLVRIRLSEQEDGTVRVSRLVYEPSSEAAQAYERRAARAEPQHPRRRRRSRRQGAPRGSEPPKPREK